RGVERRAIAFEDARPARRWERNRRDVVLHTNGDTGEPTGHRPASLRARQRGVRVGGEERVDGLGPGIGSGKGVGNRANDFVRPLTTRRYAGGDLANAGYRRGHADPPPASASASRAASRGTTKNPS